MKYRSDKYNIEFETNTRFDNVLKQKLEGVFNSKLSNRITISDETAKNLGCRTNLGLESYSDLLYKGGSGVFIFD